MLRAPVIVLAVVGVCLPLGLVADDAPAPSGKPIVAAFFDLAHIHKWDSSNGDSWDPFWADDGQLYAFNCDGAGFGSGSRNLALNELFWENPAAFTGSRVNGMDEYGKADATGPDGATWKICGQECIDGVFYGFVCRNTYGNKSHDPQLRQTSVNASLIKSTDHGKTWTRSAAENYAHPMWPGSRFGAPGFIHYGQNGGAVTADGADQYVYAISNNGFWNNGDDFILARVPRKLIGRQQASDWSYVAGVMRMDPMNTPIWSTDIAKARPILVRPSQCGWTSATYIPALGRYVLTSWYVDGPLKSWFAPARMNYDVFEAPHPWGPWTQVGSRGDDFLSDKRHMYGPSICARFQKQEGSAVRVVLFTSGCPFEGAPTGLYKCWEIPVVLKTERELPSLVLRHNAEEISYGGQWQTVSHRLFAEAKDDVNDLHFTQQPGDTAALAFTGTGLDYLAEKCWDQGRADVSLDGGAPQTVSLATPNFPRVSGAVVWSVRGLPPGQHRVKITCKAGCVTVDGFRVYSNL
jgi:hypothetical protein